MAERLNILQDVSRKEQYESLLPQIAALLEGESDEIANMANIAAALKEAFGFFWVGFYRVKDDELVLGPFQGPVACTRIKRGRGVCGTVWEQARAFIVPNVEAFPGHIACSSLSRSEIVVPIVRQQEIVGVLDVDSDRFGDFAEIDAYYLNEIVRLL